MKTQSLIQVLSSQTEHIRRLLGQLIAELTKIKAEIDTVHPSTSSLEPAYLEKLSTRSEQIMVGVEQLQAYLQTLELRSRDARAAALGS
jgi:hypothetical protein